MHKRIAVAFLLITTLFSLSAKDKIRVGFYSMEHCMEVDPETHRYSGYIYDYLQEVAAINGWSYEYIFAERKVLMNMLKEGRIDILPGIVNYNNSENGVLFTQIPLFTNSLIIARKSETQSYIATSSIMNYNNKTFGSVKGSYQNIFFEEWCKKYNIKVQLKNYEETSDVWNALENGEVEYVLAVNEISPVMPCEIRIINTDNIYIAVAPEETGVLKDLNYADGKLKEKRQYLFSQLYRKYFRDVPTNYTLSARQIKYLNQKQVIRIGGIKHYSPYVSEDEYGNIDGIFPRVFDLLKNKLFISTPVEWILYNDLDELRTALKAGEIDLISTEYYDYEVAENNGLHISDPVVNAYMGMLYCENQPPDNKYCKIAACASKPGFYYVKELYPNATIVPCKTTLECVELVKDGFADCAISQMTVMDNAAKLAEFEYTINELMSPCKICFGAASDTPSILALVNKGLELISEEEMNEIEMSSRYVYNYDITLSSILSRYRIPIIIICFIVFLFIVLYFMQLYYTKQIEKTSAAKSLFLSNMSHDIRTPMNAIIGFTNMAIKDISNPEVALEYLKKTQSASSILLTLVNKILDMSQIENGVIKLVDNKADMYLAGDNLLPMLTEMANAKNIKLSFRIENIENRFVYLDVVHMNQILINLVSNAIKYTNEGGNVDIIISQELGQTTDPAYGMYRFVIKDNGIGMSPEFQKHMYELFSREHSTTEIGSEGAGLGLTIVKRLVDKMGGTIDVESAYSLGTTFILHIPLRIQDGKIHENLTVENEIKPSVNFNDIRVLIVEDNDFNREISVDLFNELGVKSEEAVNGKMAVEMLQQKGPDYYNVIFMDIQMPVMDGYEATRQIRKMYPKKRIPIVALSANAFSEDKLKSKEVGMDEHLNKPVEITNLIDVLCRFA